MKARGDDAPRESVVIRGLLAEAIATPMEGNNWEGMARVDSGPGFDEANFAAMLDSPPLNAATPPAPAQDISDPVATPIAVI